MKPDDFDRLLRETLADLPAEVRAAIKNVQFIFAGVPTRKQMDDMSECDDCGLLGLYEGVPLAERDPGAPPLYPDRITVFRKAHVEAFEPDQLEDAVRETILHELGHYLGWDDEKLEELGL